MGGVTGVSGSSSASFDTTDTSVARAAPPGASLMPDPYASAPVLDDIALLYLVQSKNAQLGLSEGRLRVRSAAQERDVLRKEQIDAEMKAIEEAREAANSHGFWGGIGDALGTVAKIAGVVASIALAVVTVGAAAPIAALAIAGAVLSTASFVDSEARVLEKLGVDPQTAGWLDLGMSVGAAACSGGANLAGAARPITTTMTLVTEATEAGAHVVRAVDAVEQSRFKADEEGDLADALAAERASARLQERLIAYLDELKDSTDSDHRTMKTTQGVIATLDDTALAAAR